MSVVMNYFTVFMDVLLKPSEFFRKISRENNFIHALIFSIVFLLITTLVGDFFETMYIIEELTIPGTIFFTEMLHLLVINASFTMGNIISFKLLGGEGSYKDTFIIMAYSTVVMPIEYLPMSPINILMGIYWVHICSRGGQFVHNLSYWKSFFTVLAGSFVFSFLFDFTIIGFVYAL
uniref:Yip1 domain-containing protein n=2 Tax=Methanosarcina barkeri TaxID=2208 RepID=Q468I9_METBF